jgi:sulfate transport system ATP-binding protein/putative spermidine/putrescine transport system ATP-binding protein
MSVVKNLIKDYGDFKIDIPEWHLLDQGVMALVGPSGSGKTSVIRLLLGLEECSGLQWLWPDQDIAKLPIGERRLGVVFQSYDLFPHLTARQNIDFAARARKIPEEHKNKRMAEIIKRLKLESCMERSAQVALARALIGEPRFLFLDEPFSALDADLRAEARLLVKEAIQTYQIPTLLVSHDAADVQALADQVVQIRAGKLLL